MERKQYKAINFDLSTSALKRFYPSPHFRQAYRDIGRFLAANGFEHRQWSGYRSIRAMSDAEITLLISRLNRQFTWLSQCVNRFDVTNIGKNYDLTALFTQPIDLPEPVPIINEKPLSGPDPERSTIPKDDPAASKKRTKRNQRTTPER